MQDKKIVALLQVILFYSKKSRAFLEINLLE